MVSIKTTKYILLGFFICILANHCFSMDKENDTENSIEVFDTPNVSTKEPVLPGKFSRYPTFHEWKSECKKLPFFKDSNNKVGNTSLLYEEFKEALLEFIKEINYTDFRNKKSWLNADVYNNSIRNFFIAPLKQDVFQPFVQKYNIPTTNTIVLKGDLHGDIHSLIAFIDALRKLDYMDELNPFCIKDSQLRLVFLGDYTDRGIYGVEVLYTLIRLKISNPTQVFLLRGNHEDIVQNLSSGLYAEFNQKFNKSTSFANRFNLLKLISRFYSLLPACLYLGIRNEQNYTHYLQCCHGGMEIGYNPSLLLENPVARFEFLKDLHRCQHSKNMQCLQNSSFKFRDVSLEQEKIYGNIGFMWSDFIVNPETSMQQSNRGNEIYAYGKNITQELLTQGSGKNYRICGVFRAHQHTNSWTEMMQLILDKDNLCAQDKGVGKLWKSADTSKSFWDGIVCTLMVSPDSPMGDANITENFPANHIDYCAFLTPHEDFDQWHFEVLANDIYS